MKRLKSALLKAQTESSADDMIAHALEAIRSHLDMDVAYVSEFVDDRSVMRAVDAPGLEHVIKVGDSFSLDEVYCRHILEGRLPEAIPDTSKVPLAASMPITSAVPIGSHMSVPIRLPDGDVYGMFCCLSPKPNSSLNDRDIRVMRLFADMAGHQIGKELATTRSSDASRQRIHDVIDQHAFTIAYQPIFGFREETPVGFEALTRFSAEPQRTPDLWFGEAADAGLGLQLELAAVKAALDGAGELPEGCYLSLNASPDTILSGRLLPLLSPAPGRQVVIEVTEHAPVAAYDALCEALKPLRDTGVMLAVDDAGAGYATLQHILQLDPEIIKLDIGLTRGIDGEPARRALAAALIFFARETGAEIVAEGIETQSELDTLRALGVDKGQGYLLGRPMSLEQVRAAFGTAGPGRLRA